MENERLPRILLIYRSMIPSIRLCGHVQMQALCDKGKIEYRYSSVRNLARQDLSWPDIVLLGRLDTRAESYVVRRLKQMGKYLVYVLDDDLLNVPDGVSSADYYGTREVKQQIRWMISQSNAILSPSPLILEKYALAPIRPILVEEPAIDPISFREHEPGEPVTIGFAGSVDRVPDIEGMLEEVLRRIQNQFGERVMFSFFGAIPSFAQDLNAQVIPYQDSYDEYRHMLNDAHWDIGLAPMTDSTFHRFKHYNKFCEYAAAGIVGVFSRNEPYIRLEKTIGIGLFCENTVQSWYDAIAELLEHPQKREQLRERACQYAHEHLSPETIADDFMLAYADVFGYRATQYGHRVVLHTIMLRQAAARLHILWQAHGMGTLGYLIRRCINGCMPERIRERILRQQMKRANKTHIDH